jgi:hypothetical protein
VDDDPVLSMVPEFSCNLREMPDGCEWVEVYTFAGCMHAISDSCRFVLSYHLYYML